LRRDLRLSRPYSAGPERLGRVERPPRSSSLSLSQLLPELELELELDGAACHAGCVGTTTTEGLLFGG